MYMNGVCSKITAYNDFYIGRDPEIRYENETVTLDQCCLASLDAQTEEQKDQLLGACFYDTLVRSKYYFQDDVCFNYTYSVNVYATSEEHPVYTETDNWGYSIADRDYCCLYSNKGDYNLEACDSY